ncbi:MULTISPECIES: hypothetical protein [unclassified Streptomyces]|uniref:hypothetical protein n=1 Tax=unclassified Streptomyces TaxID=2593676 RepID=UPI00131904CC|nr:MULTISPECIES: hypothetical protein [unclassified Streptomyces]QHC32421.1 hypothetical protein GR129_30160 [Streptomyces sp. HF10]WKE68544.1 hypothetical protein QHG49_05625 [Streptomyces sp. WP-1]
METCAALVALIGRPAALRYVAVPAGAAVATRTAYFVQPAARHRPSDIVRGAGVCLLWALLATAVVPGTAEQIASWRTDRPRVLSLCAGGTTVAAVRRA